MKPYSVWQDMAFLALLGLVGFVLFLVAGVFQP